jgi:hypothetical protein
VIAAGSREGLNWNASEQMQSTLRKTDCTADRSFVVPALSPLHPHVPRYPPSSHTGVISRTIWRYNEEDSPVSSVQSFSFL